MNNNVNEEMEKQSKVLNLWQAFCKDVREIQTVYFKNERWFDRYDYPQFLGFDNVCFEEWEFEETEYRDAYRFVNAVRWTCECHGYGIGAASRGFDVTKPEGLLWTICVKVERHLSAIAEIMGYKTSNYLNEDVAWLHDCHKRYREWLKSQEAV